VTVEGSQPAGDSAAGPDDSATALEVIAVDLSGKKPSRSAHTLKRARQMQQDAAAAMDDADQNPALGALNRHLNMMLQQLEMAHRVIGRVAAERDALRQQLADLQGIPVDEIVVTSIGASKEDRPAKTHEHHHAEPQAPTAMSRLNYFAHEDIAVMRKRRQMFVLVLLVVVVGLWFAGRMGAWEVPDNLSRDSVSRLPFIGEFMSYFLAGWLLFRFAKVTGKGVRWVFPNEHRHRRR